MSFCRSLPTVAKEASHSTRPALHSAACAFTQVSQRCLVGTGTFRTFAAPLGVFLSFTHSQGIQGPSIRHLEPQHPQTLPIIPTFYCHPGWRAACTLAWGLSCDPYKYRANPLCAPADGATGDSIRVSTQHICTGKEQHGLNCGSSFMVVLSLRAPASPSSQPHPAALTQHLPGAGTPPSQPQLLHGPNLVSPC